MLTGLDHKEVSVEIIYVLVVESSSSERAVAALLRLWWLVSIMVIP